MEQSLISQLKGLINYKNYMMPESNLNLKSDDVIDAKIYDYDVDFFFKEGFKLGLQMGLECVKK